MKLSEAMALGRVLLKPKAKFLIDGEGSGCALGMALTAIGVKIEKPSFIEEPPIQWPWLKKSCERPCSCGGSYVSYTQAIAHIFDDHVMKSYWESWTLDELIDWIKSVEPAEEPKRRKKNQKQDKTEASRATKEITLQI